MVFTSIEWRARRASTGSKDWRQEETTQLKWLGSPPSQDHQRRLGALAKNLRIRQLDGTPNHKWSDYSHSRMHALNSSFMTDKPDISRHLHQDLAQRIPKIIDKQNKTNPYQSIPSIGTMLSFTTLFFLARTTIFTMAQGRENHFGYFTWTAPPGNGEPGPEKSWRPDSTNMAISLGKIEAFDHQILR